MYDVQQSIKQPLSFGLEARVLHQGMVAGNESERDVIRIGSL
jgi:hypothetical protein